MCINLAQVASYSVTLRQRISIAVPFLLILDNLSLIDFKNLAVMAVAGPHEALLKYVLVCHFHFCLL